jgi:hypothetical protein
MLHTECYCQKLLASAVMDFMTDSLLIACYRAQIATGTYMKVSPIIFEF